MFTGLQADYTVTTVDAAGAPVPLGSAGSVTTVGDTVGAGATSLVVTGLTNGSAFRLQVSATNAFGTSPFSAFSDCRHTRWRNCGPRGAWSSHDRGRHGRGRDGNGALDPSS